MSQLLDPASELSIMVVATCQADLRSDNFLTGAGGAGVGGRCRQGGVQVWTRRPGCRGQLRLTPLFPLPPPPSLAAVCTALSAICHIVTPELVGVFLPQVTALLRHDRDLVKKRALLALQRFLQVDPAVGPEVEKHLVDKLGYKVGGGRCGVGVC